MKDKTPLLRWAFWIGLVAFLSWDYARSPAIDLRQEPPLVAAGSGQVVEGGHCSSAK
ncbi:MAG: hypothetical protein KGL68_05425 [Burkholderiales bacterium]|nr:hypothetical protein [Burkholderiales bacterium]